MTFVGQEVISPYGKGTIKQIREHDNMVLVEPLTWLLANNKPPVFYMNPKDITPLYAVGDSLTCPFGNGKLYEIRNDGIYVVKLETWKLATGKSPTLYLNKSSIKHCKVISNVDLSKQSFIEECLQTSYKHKAEATRLFATKQYETAKNKYFEALTALKVSVFINSFFHIFHAPYLMYYNILYVCVYICIFVL